MDRVITVEVMVLAVTVVVVVVMVVVEVMEVMVVMVVVMMMMVVVVVVVVVVGIVDRTGLLFSSLFLFSRLTPDVDAARPRFAGVVSVSAGLAAALLPPSPLSASSVSSLTVSLERRRFPPALAFAFVAGGVTGAARKRERPQGMV